MTLILERHITRERRCSDGLEKEVLKISSGSYCDETIGAWTEIVAKRHEEEDKDAHGLH